MLYLEFAKKRTQGRRTLAITFKKKTTMKNILILLLLLLFGCKHFNKQDEQVNQKSLTIAKDNIFSDLFVIEPNTKNMDNLFSVRFNLKKKPVKNVYDSSIIDTGFQFVYNTSEFEIYKAKDKDLFYSAVIKDKDIVLKNKIRIGLNRNEVFKNLKINYSKVDTLIFENISHIASVKLIFKDDKLIEINFYASLD